jgi:Cellulase (glycosyl hydrolase family 5)/Ricin-type beta-trefoil lectin domain
MMKKRTSNFKKLTFKQLNIKRQLPDKFRSKNAMIMLAFLLIFGAAGVYLTFFSHAATPVNIPNISIVGIGGKCLTNYNGAAADHNPVQLSTCIGTLSQLWSVKANSTGADTIVNSNGFCMSVLHGSTTPGSSVDIYTCDGTPAQNWRINSTNNSLVNVNSGLCLDDQNAITTNGNSIVVEPCNNSAEQTWNSSSPPLAIHVAANNLINQYGQKIRLFGINRLSGIPCVSGTIMQGPYDDASVAELANWHINVVRIPLNEDCWLGINGVPTISSGAVYQQAIVNYINLLNQHGLYAIIDLHLNAPGGYVSAAQQAMADQDHAPGYWASVAATFKNNNAVILEPYNEPDVTVKNALTTNPWSCWLNGCTITRLNVQQGQPYINVSWSSAGMQELVNTIRKSGATNVISLSGLSLASDLSHLLNNLPVDPNHQLTATFHNYEAASVGGWGCSSSCWNNVILPVSAQLPVITDEIGGLNCSGTFVTQYMNWADKNNISYLAWGWNPLGCTTDSSGYRYGLLSDWSGTPNAYGQTFYDHFNQVNP